MEETLSLQKLNRKVSYKYDYRYGRTIKQKELTDFATKIC